MERDMESHSLPSARRISLFRALHRSFSLKTCCCSLIVALCIIYILLCHFNHNAYSSHSSFLFSHGPCAQGYNLLPVIIATILYAVYLADCWQNRKKCLLKTISISEVESYLNSLRESTPRVWWKAVSYHYARRTRQVTRYRNGEALSANQVYYERVDTVCGEETFMYDSCGVRDISGCPQGLSKFPVVRIFISRGFAFATHNSAREFEEQRSRFFDEYEERDDYLEVREGMQLSQPVQHIMCVRQNKPWFLRPSLFWILSLCLLSWPIRALTEWRTAYMHYRVIKLFGTNYLSPSSLNYTGPLSRSSSIDSTSLVTAIYSRPLLLPSYSMALLVPPLPSLRLHHVASLRDYGSCEVPPRVLPPPPRSTSFNAFLSSSSNHSTRPARSRSFGWGRIDEETHRLIPSDNPPPYQVALRLCAPLYDRLRHSISFFRQYPSIQSPKDLPTTSN